MAVGIEVNGIEISTRTVPTVANALDVGATLLAVDGVLSDGLDTPQGLIKAGLAEVEDLINGPTARALGQTSEFGALMDSGLDKAKGILEIYDLWRKGIVPKWILLLAIAQDVVNIGATASAQAKSPEGELRPEQTGRRARFFRTAGFGVLAIGNVMKESHPRTARVVRGVGYAATGLGFGLGLHATGKYIERATA